VVINKKIVAGVAFFLIVSFILPVNADIEAPLKQMKKGVLLEDIICRNGLDLVIRTNVMPACVKPETADKMQDRGMLSTIKFTKLENVVTIPASSMSIVNFYITDHDLNFGTWCNRSSVNGRTFRIYN